MTLNFLVYYVKLNWVQIIYAIGYINMLGEFYLYPS